MTSIDHLVIAAGGRGTRLAEVAGELPKVLVPIGGKPVLQHQLELAANRHIREVTILAGHLGERIAAFVGNGSRFGLSVRTLIEVDPLGNAGLLIQSLQDLPEEFLFVYGDIMFAVDLQKLVGCHIERGAHLTAVARPCDHPEDSDLLETDEQGWITSIHLCPHPEGRHFANLGNAALYVVQREVLQSWVAEGGKLDFTRDIMVPLVASGAQVFAYRTNEYLKDMGTPQRLRQTEADWQAGRICLENSQRCCPAVFLDRDGTLNLSKGFLRRAEDLELIDGAGPAIRALRSAGFRLVVLTNQPVIARGEASEAEVAEIHRRLEWELARQGAYLDAIYYCPHHPVAGFPGERTDLKIVCDCRKPSLGLLERAKRDLNLDVARSWIIGDQTRDIEMARRAGLPSILVLTGEGGSDGRYLAAADHIAADIREAAEVVLRQIQTSTVA